MKYIIITIVLLYGCDHYEDYQSNKHSMRQLFYNLETTHQESWNWFLVFGNGSSGTSKEEYIRILADFNGYKIIDIPIDEVTFVINSKYKEPKVMFKCIYKGYGVSTSNETSERIVNNYRQGGYSFISGKEQFYIHISEEMIPKHYEKLIFKGK